MKKKEPQNLLLKFAFAFFRVSSMKFPRFRLSVLRCAIFCLFSGSLFVSAQEIPAVPSAQNFHQWGAVTLFNGLPSDNVRAIAQTPDGILWFGTDNGLARFDGRRLQSVSLENSPQIRALKLDSDGVLWIGTNNGAIRFRDGNFEPLEATKSFSINSFFFDKNVYLTTNNGFVLKLSPQNERDFGVEKIPSEKLLDSNGEPLKITSLEKIGDKLYAGTRSRSLLLIEGNQTFETFTRPRPYFINTIARDNAGNIWLGADANAEGSGLFAVRDAANLQRSDGNPGNISAIAPDKKGGAWIGSIDNGLFYFKAAAQMRRFTFENSAGGLRSNAVNTIFIDREGVVWVGTNRGVSRFDDSSPFSQLLSENSNSNFIRAFYQTNEGQFFAGTNRGLFVQDGGNWVEIENLKGKTVFGLSQDQNGKIFAATSGGLFLLDGTAKMTGDVRATANFQGKSYAAIFGRGIIETVSQSVVLANDSPTALFAEGDKNLWIGTVRDGIFVFDGKEMKSAAALETLRGAPIRKIIKGNNEDFWFAGERGLFLFRQGELQTVVANTDVRDVAISGEDVWAATLKNGLIHARLAENYGWLTTNLNAEQGMPSEQIFALFPQAERLFIGTNRGIVTYSPSKTLPQIIVSRILSRRLHEAHEIKNTIALDYPQNSILIEVAGLSSRTFPEQFQYSFALKNARAEILEQKLSNDAQFAPANLGAGEYSIEVRAFNKDLVSSAPLILKFSVARAPFPWTATALGILLFIALVGLIWAIIERRRITQTNRELAAARFDLANEAERERRRIAQDLHDQTLADLRNLMLMSDKLTSDTTNFRTEIEAVSTEIRRICEDLSPSVLENVGLAPALEFLLQHTVSNYRFSADETLEERTNFKPNVQMQIYRIAQEVLNNIKRHSDAQSIEMNLAISPENQFVLTISDDGKAFSPNDSSHKGRGINNIKSRAALIEAQTNWTETAEKRNLFRLAKTITDLKHN